MRKRSILLCSLLLTCNWAAASGAPDLNDTIRLASIQVEARMQFGMNHIGSPVQILGPELLKVNPTASIAELLSGNTQLNIKSTGNSGVATAMFRGASSYQTQTNWNGISLTPPSLGDFDFSQAPAFFIDEVAVMAGGGSARSGLGALGGTIELINRHDPAGPSVMMTSEYGSYDTWSTGYRATLSQGGTSATTRVLYQQSDNDFFYPGQKTDPESGEPVYTNVRRQGAGYNSVGAMQNFSHRFDGSGTLSANVWFQRSDNDLPMSVPAYDEAVSNMIFSGLRSTVGYNASRGASDYGLTLAYVRDMTDYSYESETWIEFAKTIGNSYVAKFDYALAANDDLDLGASVNYRHENVLSDNFEEREAHRNSISVQLQSLWRPDELFTIRAQYAPVFSNEDFAHTYAVGWGFDAIPELLSVSLTNAYNKRFPTLNDMYFANNANPDLRPESGFSFDGTITLTPTTGKLKTKIDITYFNLNVIDWIEWQADSVGAWTGKPQNVKHVLSRGVEASFETSLAAGRTNHGLQFNYSHTSTGDENNGGRQMQYVPLNKWNVRYTFEFHRLSVSYGMNHTGNRYDGNRTEMENHTIHGVQAGYTFRVGDADMRLSGRVSNLLNTSYQSTTGYPMPLRMGHIGITFTM